MTEGGTTPPLRNKDRNETVVASDRQIPRRGRKEIRDSNVDHKKKKRRDRTRDTSDSSLSECRRDRRRYSRVKHYRCRRRSYSISTDSRSSDRHGSQRRSKYRRDRRTVSRSRVSVRRRRSYSRGPSRRHHPGSCTQVMNSSNQNTENINPEVQCVEPNGSEFIGNTSKDQNVDSQLFMQSLVNALKRDSVPAAPGHIQGAQNMITDFDPSSKSQCMKDWLVKINESAAIYGWTERQTIFYALPKLSGLARKWYEGLVSVKFSWAEWQEKLLRAFPSDDNYGDILTEMLNRRSRRTETLIEYYYDKIMLINRCRLEGRQAVDCLTHGIYDYNIRMNVQAARYENPESVLDYFRNIPVKANDTFTNKRTISEIRTQNNFEPQSKRPNAILDRQPNKYQPGLSAYRRPINITCFNCGEVGHAVSRCTKELVRCDRCKRYGHVEANCKIYPSNKSSNITKNDETNTKKILSIDANKDSNNKYFKQVKVNGIEIRGYVDFGSECTLISVAICKNLNLPLDEEDLPSLRGFGNSSLKPIGKTSIRVAVDLVEVDLEAYAVLEDLIPADILIGQTLTEIPSVRAYKTNDSLTLYQIISNNTNSIVLKPSKDHKVYKDAIVEVCCSSHYTGFVSIISDSRQDNGSDYIILPGIYPINKGIGFIVVVGLGDNEIILSKNKVLARGIGVPQTIFADSDAKQSYVMNVRRLTTESTPIESSKLNVDSVFDAEVKDELLEMLNTYRDCFALTTSELGKTSVAEMKIRLNDTTPVTYRPYRLSLSERENVKQIINELLSNEVIRESNSEYSSPIILVAKKNGDQRLCVDFRALNRKTIKDKYPMPIIEDQIDSLQGQNLFTTLDLTQGYHQIPMAEDSRHLTAFVTPDGHFEYNRMPFGLTNAPAVFQKMIHSLLNKRKIPGVVAYMDDIVIGSKTIAEGFEKLREVLNLLREANLTLNIDKCHFFKTTIEYLGFEISAEGVRPGSRKTEAVADFPTPRNVHEVRQFVGLASFFRKFVRNFATIARPLTSLTRNGVSWHWGEEQSRAFAEIKEILTSRPVLTIYNPQYQTELHTDACKLGIGGVLLQREHCSAPLKAVAYFSRQTTAEEQHLHSYELETLAVVMSLNRFRVYLIGIPFKVVTDCSALRTTLTKRDLVPRIARWWLLVQDYDFTVEYRPGTQLQHADCLSRNPLPLSNASVPEMTVLNIQNEQSLLKVQLSDPRLKLIKCVLDKNCAEAKDVNNNFVLKGGIVYRQVGSELKFAVPQDARWKICQMCHDESGHFSFDKTIEKMRRDYWFPGMSRFVRKYVKACIPCAYAKEPSGKKQGYLHPIPKPSVPFECIHVDHLGPFVKSKTGNTYILGIIDAFTKFIILRAVRNTKSRTTIQVLRDIIALFGSPKVIISDRGTSFTSAEFSKFIESNQIKHIKNAVATPRANGQIERYNRSILSSLTALNIDKDDRNWDSDLNKVQWSLNNTINKSIGKTPVQVIFGKETVNLAENYLYDISNNLTPTEDIDKIRKEASSSIEKQQHAMKTRFDKKRCPAKIYKLGDLVMVLKHNRNIGDSNKLVPPYSGPYKVSAVLGNDRYEVCSIDGFSSRKYKNVYSADKIKHWIQIGAKTDSLSESESNSEISEKE